MQRNRQLFFVVVMVLWCSIVLLSSPVVLAGGWAVITLDQLSVGVTANQPITIGFVVRQHGQRPMEDLSPQIRAIHTETRESFSISAKPEGAAGHYVATLVFPQAGEWSWSIEAFSMKQAMPPLRVQGLEAITPKDTEPARSWPLLISLVGLFGMVGTSLVWWYKRAWWASLLVFTAIGVSGAGLALAALQQEDKPAVAALPSQVEIGRDLFIAKGCVTCHAHSAIPKPDIFIETGPNLTSFPTTAEYLHAWLKDPAAIKPKTEMPNLGLKKEEIEALTAFLLNSETGDKAAPAAQSKPQTDQQPAEAAAIDQAGSNAETLFFVQAQGTKGPLVVYGMPGGQEQFSLPAGSFSADWNHYYTAAIYEDDTLLSSFDPRTGQYEHSFALGGRWSLSGVSPSGRWLALTRLPAEDEAATWREEGRWQTEIEIREVDSGKTAHILQLEGNFEVETISAAGDSLFLIEHQPALKPTHYLVRLYDLAAEKLEPDALRDKAATDEVMAGLAWGGLASPDGKWLLTLYLNTQRNVAFIHALDLVNKIPFCIDLPSGQGDFGQLKYYALALTPDGKTVYATNAALGVVAEVSLESYKVVRQVEFQASAPPETRIGDEVPTNYSILTKDGQRLYFSNGWDVWGFDTSSKLVDGPYLSKAQVRGLGLAPDGRQLYVALEGQPPQVIEVADREAVSLKLD